MTTLKARKRRVRRRSAKKRVKRTKGKKKRSRRRTYKGGMCVKNCTEKAKWANCVTYEMAMNHPSTGVTKNICRESAGGTALNIDAFRDYARAITPGTSYDFGTPAGKSAEAKAQELFNNAVEECKRWGNRKDNVSDKHTCTANPSPKYGAPVFKQPSKEESKAFGQSGEDFKKSNPEATEDEVNTADLNRKRANEQWHINNILSGIAPVAVARGGRRKSRRRRRRRRKKSKQSKKRRRRRR